MTEDASRFCALCGDCGHTWAALDLPMNIADATKALNALRCPACNSDYLYATLDTVEVPA